MRHGKLCVAPLVLLQSPEHSVSQAVKMPERLVTPVPHLCCCAALNCKSSAAGKEQRDDRVPWRACMPVPSSRDRDCCRGKRGLNRWPGHQGQIVSMSTRCALVVAS